MEALLSDTLPYWLQWVEGVSFLVSVLVGLVEVGWILVWVIAGQKGVEYVEIVLFLRAGWVD